MIRINVGSSYVDFKTLAGKLPNPIVAVYTSVQTNQVRIGTLLAFSSGLEILVTCDPIPYPTTLGTDFPSAVALGDNWQTLTV